MSHDKLGPLRLWWLDRHHWQLVEPFTYRSITVPKGFITDGASSPFRTLITAWGGHYSKAVVVHDYLCERLNQKDPHPDARTRKQADAIFRQILRESGVRPVVRFGMWAVVRLFGGPMLKGIGVR